LRHKIFYPLEKGTSLSQISLPDFKILITKALG